MIVAGSTSQALAADLAAATGRPLARTHHERFPDGELLAATPGFAGERAVVVASTVSSDAHLEVLQLQDAVRTAGADEVITVLPYMGYARQDAAYDPAGGETEGYPVSARAVARAIGTGADRVLTVNPHEPAVCDFFEVPAAAVDAAARLAAPLPEDLTDPVFLAPDAGARDLAATVRDAYGRGALDHFEKTRRSSTEVELAPSDVAVADRDVVVADDIVATGSTMCEAIERLRAAGANRAYVACVHAVFVDDARTRLARAGATGVYATDTIERAVSAVSAAPAVAAAL